MVLERVDHAQGAGQTVFTVKRTPQTGELTPSLSPTPVVSPALETRIAEAVVLQATELQRPLTAREQFATVQQILASATDLDADHINRILDEQRYRLVAELRTVQRLGRRRIEAELAGIATEWQVKKYLKRLKEEDSQYYLEEDERRSAFQAAANRTNEEKILDSDTTEKIASLRREERLGAKEIASRLGNGMTPKQIIDVLRRLARHDPAYKLRPDEIRGKLSAAARKTNEIRRLRSIDTNGNIHISGAIELVDLTEQV